MRTGFISLLIIGVVSVVGSLPLKAQSLNPQTSNTAPNIVPPANDVYFLNRAKNLARQAAINANGGLGKYRPDLVMYGPAIQTVYVRNNDGSITFRFAGSAPGHAVSKFETVATVAPTGVVKLDYNGTPRTAIDAASLPVTPSTSMPSTNTLATVAVPELTPSSPSSSSSPLPLSPADGPLPQPVAIAPTSAPVKGVPTGMPPAIAWVDQDAFVARAQNLARQAAIKANGGLAAYRPEASMFGPSARSPFVKNSDGSLTFTFQGGAPGASGMTLLSVVIVDLAGNVKIQYNGPPVR
jgi:hypothetical protein